MGSLVYEDYLYHHGVKGQRWGKRNGPPYPLYRKTSYYQKTGKRPPGYTGEKKGSIGGFISKEHKREYKQWHKENKKWAKENGINRPLFNEVGDEKENFRPLLIPEIRNKVSKKTAKEYEEAYDDLWYQHSKLNNFLNRNDPKATQKIHDRYAEARKNLQAEYSSNKKGHIGGFKDHKINQIATKAHKKWVDDIPNSTKNVVAGTAVGAAALGAGVNVAATKKGIQTTKKVLDKVKKRLPTTAKAVKKGEKKVFTAAMTKLKKKQTLAILASAAALGVGAHMLKKKDERDKKLEKIKKGRIGGLGSSSNSDSISELPSKYNKERENAKIEVRDGVKVRIQNKKLSDDENMDRVNPTFRDRRNVGNEENCIACSVTMEARKRGLEYTARTDLAHDDDPDTCFNSVGKVYKNAKAVALGTDAKTGTNTFKSYYKEAEKLARRGANKELVHRFTTAISKMPKGSRGQICIMFDRYSGHSMYFTKGANGKLIFYDTQRNRKYTEDQLASQLISSSSNVIFQRFDNCEINYKELMKYSR